MKIMLLMRTWILLELLHMMMMVEMLSLRQRLNQLLLTIQPTHKQEGLRFYLGMQGLNVKIVREPLVVHQVYGTTQSRNMMVSSILVTSVTIKLDTKVI